MHCGVDDEYADAGMKAQGLLIASYRFYENPKQKRAGVFDGIMTLWWYMDRDGKIHYDDIRSYSDNYRNNQYVGTWVGYGKKRKKPCNWGEHRIPFSGDLDIGAAEFSANPAYYDKGWQHP